MIIGIMQPYFFPYLGYFDAIFKSDTWVVFDIVQYTSRSWMTRNRILHPTKDWQYINCDVSGSQNMKIYEVQLKDSASTEKKILGQITHYKRHAPFYDAVVGIIKETFGRAKSSFLVDVNVSAISSVCDYLGVPFNPIVASEANFTLPSIEHAGQWALEICHALGGSVYINPPGGRDLFIAKEFSEKGIKLGFTHIPKYTYPCAPYTHINNLSIIDVLLWNDVGKVRAVLGNLPVDYVTT